MEQLFDQNALARITLFAKQNAEDYTGGIVVKNDTTPETLITISAGKGLIFTKGSEDTGFSHLTNRHSPFSFHYYWLPKEDAVYSLDNPSKFHPRMMPIIDYVRIADTIFCEANKNITKNYRPELFDKYTGIYFFEEEVPEKYHLLTYKDTKIVHTLFPDKKRHNFKNKTKFARGSVSATTKLPEGFNDLRLPYLNSNNIPVYTVLFRKYYLEKIERLFIVKHNTAGEYEHFHLLGHRTFTAFESFDRDDMHALQYGDVSDFEFLINEMERQNK